MHITSKQIVPKKMTMKFALVWGLFAAIWLNCSAQSNMNQVATTVAMPLKSNWVIGTTLDSGKPSPFTRESIEEMEKAFKTTVIEEYGEYEAVTKLVSNNREKMEALGIDTSLSVSYMGFTV